MPATTKLLIAPYRKGSKSVKKLFTELKALNKKVQVIHKPSIRATNLVINWGKGDKVANHNNVLNLPDAINAASDKVTAFKRFLGVGIQTPKVAFSREEAATLRFPVVCRTLTRSSEGKGIVIANTPEELVNAKLYTEYKKKKAEFRYHVFKGEVLDVQQKRKRQGVTPTDTRVRNTANGYVFCREGVQVSEEAKQLAIAAVKALKLDFGAVDIIYNAHENKYYVLEVNTAPGIEGTTVKKYANAIATLV